MEMADLLVVLTISNRNVAGSIIVSASRECVLDGVIIVKGFTKSTQTMTQGSDSVILGGSSPYFLHSFLPVDTLDQWNIVIQHFVRDQAMSWYS